MSFFYLLAQMAGAGGLVSLLLGLDGDAAQNVVIALVGIIMIAYVLIGGMKGTTYVQIVKASLLIAGSLVITFWVLAKFGFSLSNVLGAAVDNSPRPAKLLGRAEVRHVEPDQDRLHLAVAGPGARHRWSPTC